jgi:hypothetical protein
MTLLFFGGGGGIGVWLLIGVHVRMHIWAQRSGFEMGSGLKGMLLYLHIRPWWSGAEYRCKKALGGMLGRFHWYIALSMRPDVHSRTHV